MTYIISIRQVKNFHLLRDQKPQHATGTGERKRKTTPNPLIKILLDISWVLLYNCYVNNFFKETHDMNDYVNDLNTLNNSTYVNDNYQRNIAERTFDFCIDKMAKTSIRLVLFLARNFSIFRNRAYRGYKRQYGDSWWYQFDWVKRTFLSGEDWTYYRKKEVVASFGPERPSPFNQYKNDGGIIVLSSSFKTSKKAALKKWCEENWSLLAPNSSWTIGFFTHGFPRWLCIEIAGGGITYDEMFDIAENVRDYFGESVRLRLYKSKGCWSVGFDKIVDDEDWHNAKRL
ncbi:MAG: hypothetical protein LBS70_08880 [Candidatus Accumulibacter sp.]|jgi:predicted nucleotidyltransferase|nr:hypothetical protein [Accumulibacter sp.]